MIEGYTDSTGHPSYNMRLSEKRARSVEAALEKMGVGSDRIASVKGFGERYPVADNGTAEGRQDNRRVEIVISEPNGKFLKDR
jgi:outer membrane protein OmpA-like peptidoglycan-associated protein